MSARPIDIVIGRAEPFGLRENGPGRWRCKGFCHGGSNPSAVSIGEGDGGVVLLRCWHGCSVDQIARALGLELADLFPPRPEAPRYGAPPLKRRRLLTAGQALELLEFEISLAVLCDQAMARGEALDDATRDRLRQAAARIVAMRDEVVA